MDLNTVTSFRQARARDDLALRPGEVLLAGGTWLMSEPQPDATGFVDLTTLDWPDLEISDAGLRVGATCTIARLVAWADGDQVPPDWAAAALFPAAANALLASFKIWNTATVGGNVCRSFAAGAMISAAVALDATAWVWCPDGTDRRLPVADLITGNGTNDLAAGDVLRAIEFPAATLRSRVLLHKIALAELGRSGAVVTGRVDEDGSCVFTVTAATLTPQIARFPALPDAGTLTAAIGGLTGWYTDPLGSADWRYGVSVVLAQRLRGELRGPA